VKRRSALLAALFAALLVVAGLAPATAAAASRPVITGLSAHHGAYWGGAEITIRGAGFAGVQEVSFGPSWAPVLRASASSITVRVPWHDYATVHIRVRTGAGTSRRTTADRFRFVRPSMTSPIMGGWTARQEQRISAHLRAEHHGVRIARAAHGWTPAVGRTALRRAESWLGLPYSWAGGNGSGPTRGVCTHNGGDLDCHVIGFDCSGLTLYAWSPYRHLAHFAQTQKGQAGRFHPAIGQLVPGDLVFFSAYIPSGIGHVAIYAGNGMVVEAPGSGQPVRRSRLSDVSAYSHYRGATRPLTGRAHGPAPARLSVAAAVPTAGGTVVLRGANLAAATSVSIGGRLTYSFAERSANRLVVRVPGHRAGTVAVTVSNPWGSARTSLHFVAAPHVRHVAPPSGPVTGGTTVTLTGRHLAGVTGATVDGRPLPVAVTSDTQARLVMPAHPAGVVRITLHSPFGDAGSMTYIYTEPALPSPSPSPSSS
jgi:cell wall-associated NlpC family hydrolase